MNALLIVAGLFVLYEVLVNKAQVQALLGGTPTTTTTQPGTIGQGVSGGGTTVSSGGLTYQYMPASSTGPGGTDTMIGTGVSAGLSAIPVIGPVLGGAFSAIFGGLMAASAKRAAQAKNENAAVAQEIAPWDGAIQQIVSAFNSGQITASEAAQLLASPQSRQQNVNQYPNGPVWNSFWQVVGPQVQPGRNGCNSGTAPHQPPLTHCSGSYGAGCCVAYDDLDSGQLYVTQAIMQASNSPGTPVTSQQIPAVYASKYGGVDRPGYTVTVTAPSGAGSSSNFMGL
jgi:hypothetical protein